jgi:hydroxymethylpyrimidine pyrophosphatase-like HAD family hydrolase
VEINRGDQPWRSTVEQSWAAHNYRAIAVDFDGTLTRGAVPETAVLDHLGVLRAQGLRVVLVTGRIMSELRHSFGDVDDHFDAIVAENGAVLSTSEGDMALAPPVPIVLEDAVVRHSIPVRRGQVLLACDSVYDTVVLTEIHRLGLDCQVIFNRAAMMVLPVGISKVSGLREALAMFSLSSHNTIAIGDAENDLGMLAMCGLGVAVANAVPSLKEHADLITQESAGQGVLEVLTGPVLTGGPSLQPARWRINIGINVEKKPVQIPTTHTNLLILGGSNAGKSHAGGMFAESLIGLNYSTLVVDFEGDHAGLGSLPGVLLMGGSRTLPAPAEVALLLRHRCGSMVLDLSMLPPVDQDRYVMVLGSVLKELRERTGLPQWIVTDEAHRPYGTLAPALQMVGGKGHCLISWSPCLLHPEVVNEMDLVLALPASREHRTVQQDREEVAQFMQIWIPETAEATMQIFDRAMSGQALLVNRSLRSAELVTLRSRRTNHVRHWHKYARASLPEGKRFMFRTIGGLPTGQLAANLYEFHHILRQSTTEVVLHHCRHRDFSQWAKSALADLVLSQRFSEIEGLVDHVDTAVPGDLLRQRLLVDIEQRYLTGSHCGPLDPVL